jgi:hypothetical protein
MVADPYTTKTVNVPDLEKLRRDTFAFSLYNLKPTHVYYNRPMTCFGMGMSDGQKARGGAGKPDRTA